MICSGKRLPLLPNLTMIEVLATDMLTIRQESDLLLLGSCVRQYGARAGMSRLEQTKLSTAASELARNMLSYADGGIADVDYVRRDQQKGVRLTCSDTGPGIADIDLAMQNGYSTGGSMGLGLPGAKRLASEFSLTSTVGVGTTVIILHWASE